jgi:mannose-6-phosphate isomerase
MSIDWTAPQLAICKVQDYAWGCKGPDAYIAKLMGLKNTDSPMAELWMGAHPKAPAIIQGESLFNACQKESFHILGPDITKKFGQLPYLFKVLSAGDALSIQLHPNKKEAEELHQKDPSHYPDDNHKPEIAIALDELEALLGFESIQDLISNIKNHPELQAFLGHESLESLEKAQGEEQEAQLREIKRLFSRLFSLSLSHTSQLKELTEKMAQRLQQQNHLNDKDRWFCKLQKVYPEGDVGLFCLYFLCFRTLKAGEGVFLKADVPHAYLSGNIIECMANSDNVVRAGLTPKFVDIETLANIVLVESEPLKVQTETDNGLGGGVFKVPVPEFEVHHWNSDERELDIQLSKIGGPRFVIVTEGAAHFSSESGGLDAKKGDVIFLADACSSHMRLPPKSHIYLASVAQM